MMSFDWTKSKEVMMSFDWIESKEVLYCMIIKRNFWIYVQRPLSKLSDAMFVTH